ncbi:tetratricopeptide repeat protein [Sphingomonas sp. BAUL-RG-20F-R05-02]|uniref:O-linked N-acetylglucosamine transferase, SPINDLY family protein n=1 Tax=Sphingomonas sp. BAUL-RG-20F-R05-02 TaxID=2914830 RepID=UPI001F598AAD|nr:tetratricopeptide repeat protein [Sphingomonas sp. BAUL-RG-20F-R05-02]
MTPRELLGAALRHHQSGQLDAAEQGYRAVLAIEPRHADALHLLGVIAHQRGDNDNARRLIADAIAQNDRVAAFHNNLGNVLVQLGRHSEAGTAYARAVQLQPAHAEAHAGLAGALAHQGELPAALAAIDRAITLRPHDAGKHVNRGNILAAMGSGEAAIASYRRAIELDAKLPAAHNNLGLALAKREDFSGAVHCYRHAITIAPDHADAYLNLGNALQEIGDAAGAADAYRAMLSRWPDRADARLALAMTAIPMMPRTADAAAATPGAFAAALDDLAAWASRAPTGLHAVAGTSQPFYLAYRNGDVTAPLRQYGDLVATPAPASPRHASPGDGRIRLAIVSAQVRDHPVWRIILKGLLTHLDRSRFAVTLYHLGTMSDAQTKWAANTVDHFVTGARPATAWQAVIAQDQPDIILYPEVGMDAVTGALAAKRLAPVQAAFWGHPITTGLPTIDLFFSGAALEAADADQHYRERLVRLPRTGVCLDWHAGPAEPWRGPPRSPGTVRFAICQQPIKFDPADDALLARIARDAGACEFWFVMPHRQRWAGEQLIERLRASFAQAGLDPDSYIKTTEWMTAPAFNGFLDAMHVYLDCPAFSGFTTALQALQRGLPIVTLEGRFLRQRLAAGLLRDLGVPEGIATSPDEYVARATGWAAQARDAAGWADARETLRGVAAGVVPDPAPIRQVEAALLACLDTRPA